MVDPPALDRRDYVTGGVVAALLLVAYVVYPRPVVKYGVWLVIFTIWMVWFVSFGVAWLYRDSGERSRD